MISERLYLTHFNRGQDFCPLCSSAIVWRKVGERKYCPCDSRPVLCTLDEKTNFRVVYKGELIAGVKILTSANAAEFVGKKTFYALQPHIFTCTALKHYRKGGKS